MKRYDAKIDASGRVTIPAEVRKHLRVSAGDRVSFVLGPDDVMIVARRTYTFESARGAVPAIPGMSLDFDKEIEEALEEAYEGRY